MKSVFGVILIILIFIMLTGCSEEGEDISDTTHKTVSQESLSYSESYTDLSEQFIKGQYIGVNRSEILISEDTIFMESSEAIGFERVNIYGVRGNITVMFEDEKSKSCLFGSEAFTDKTELSVQINTVNEKVAEALGVPVQDFDFICNDKTLDELKGVFAGKGVLKTEYDFGTYSLTVSAIGSNDEAVITVTQLLK